MFNWEDLHYFATFAHEKSLSATARLLNVDHATIARRIVSLEASLNLKLVDRRKRVYLLTADGQKIAAIATTMEQTAYAIERAAMAGQAEIGGEVTISAPPAVTNIFIAPNLSKLQQKYPNITIRLISETRIALLQNKESDIAIRLIRPTENDLVARKIGQVEIALYATADYLTRTTPEQYAFIAFDEKLDYLTQQKWLYAYAANRPIVLRALDIETQRIAAVSGLGIAALPDYLADLQPSLVRLEVDESSPKLDIWIVVHHDLRNAPAVRAVIDFLAQCFETHLY